jgi:TRAP-type transport system periplasmic protein
MKKALGMLLSLAVFTGGMVSANGSQDAAVPAGGNKKSYTLKYAELNPDGHIMDQCADYFADLVSKKSDGRIKIQVFPAGQLGDEKTMYQTVQMGGTIDMCRANTNSLGDFGVKKLTLFGLPFIFRDRTHLWNVLNSEIGKEFLHEPEDLKTGFHGLFYLDEGARNFFTVKNKPVHSIADFKGMKLRVPTTALMSDTVAALGVQSTPISFSELYSALQSGTVDGAEQPNSGYYSNKFYEVAPNYILTGHTYSPSIVIMSQSCWDKLDDEARKIIVDASQETMVWNRANIEKLDNDLLAKIKAAGATVVEVKDKTPYINATKAVAAKYSKGYEQYYDAILAK